MTEKLITVTFKLTIPEGKEAPPDGHDIATYLACLVGDKEGNPGEWYTLDDPTVFMEPIAVAVGLEGGVVQGGSAEIPVTLVTVDYDTEGADPSEVYDVPQHGETVKLEDGSEVPKTAEALVYSQSLEVRPEWVADVLECKPVDHAADAEAAEAEEEARLAGTPWDTWRRELAGLLDITPSEAGRIAGAYESFNTLVPVAAFAEGYRAEARREY